MNINDRMKSFYENRTRYYLPRKTWSIIRLDGKAFRTFTKQFNKPYDEKFINAMDETAKFLCAEIQGAKMAYVQSDEISILLGDMDTPTTDAWYDGNIQKIASISASLATAKFNSLLDVSKLAFFDSRVFTVPQFSEVRNYFYSRQKDCIRNSKQMVGRSHFSHKEINGKNTDEVVEMLKGVNVDWYDIDVNIRIGRSIFKESYKKNDAIRTRWDIVNNVDYLTVSEDMLSLMIVKYENFTLA